MGKLLAQVVPLALGAAISPVLFLLQLSTLTGPRRLGRGAAVAAGAAVPLLVIGAIAVVLGNAASGGGESTAKALIDIGFGGLLAALGIRTLRRDSASQAPKQKAAGSPRRSFMYGLAAMGTNVTTFALYIPAMKEILTSDVSTAESVVAVLVVMAITLAAALVPLALTVVAPSTADRTLSRLGAWMDANRRRNTAVICFLFAALLVAKGLGEL